MAEEAGKIGYGTIVRVGQGATPTWTKLAHVTGVTMPEDEIDEIEVTHMESPGRRKQFIAGLIDSGEMTVAMNYLPGSATDTLLRSLKASGANVLVEVTLPDADPDTFSGYLSGYSPGEVTPGEKMSAEATFRISELVTP